MIQRIFILKTVSLFKEIPGNLLAKIAPFLQEMHLKSGDILIHKGDISKTMYIVVEGKVRVHNEEHTLQIVGKREVFGELDVLSRSLHVASVTALEETQLYCLEQDILYELMAENSELARGLIQGLTKRFL